MILILLPEVTFLFLKFRFGR